MARKNTRYSDNSELFVFDQRTKAVMAQAQTDINSIKEKVQSVREVVPGRSNNEIVLVLQYYDNDVAQAIQAFLEDGAKEALQEWRHQPGNKPAAKKKKRNKSKGPKSEANVGSQGNLAGTEAEGDERISDPKQTKTSSTTTDTNKNLVNGHVENDVTSTHKSRSQPTPGSGSRPSGVKDTRSDSPRPQRSRGKPGALSLKPQQPPATAPTPTAEPSNKHAGLPTAAMETKNHSNAKPATSVTSQRPHTLDVNRNQVPPRDRTQSEASTTSTSSRKPLAGLEKSTKDLQRQTISLQRLKTTLNDEVERSFKNISKVFEELRRQLNDREAELMYQLDSVKTQASDILTARQKRAAELKVLTDRSGSMNEAEVAELRADIKHFVSDRKVDEDLGTTERFTCDLQNMGNDVKNFGQVHEVKQNYRQRRSSVSSLSSSIVSHDDLQSPFTPLSSSNPFSPSSSFSSQPPSIAPAVSSSARVVGQSESLTRYELNDLQNRLSGLSVKDKDTPRANMSPRGRGARAQPDKRGPRNPGADKTSSEKQDSSTEDDAKKSRNARRRQKQRERQKESKRSGQSDLSETESEVSLSSTSKGQVKVQPPKANKPAQKPDEQNKSAQPKPGQGQKGEEGQGRRNQGRRTPSPQKRRPQERAQGENKEKKEDNKDKKDDGSQASKPRSSTPRNRNNKNKSDSKPVQNGPAKQGDNKPSGESQKKNTKSSNTPDKQVNGQSSAKPATSSDKPANGESKPEPTSSQKQNDVTTSETVKSGSSDTSSKVSGDTADQPKTNNKSVTVSVKSETKPPKTAEVSALGDVSNHVKTDVNANTHVNGALSDQETALPQRKPRARANRRQENKDMVNGDVHVNGDVNSNSEIIENE